MNQNIYSEVMYKVLDYINSEKDYEYPGDIRAESNVATSLVKTGNKNLISTILSDGDIHGRTLGEVLKAYFDIGDNEEVLKILQRTKGKSHNFEMKDYMDSLLMMEDGSNLIFSFIEYLEQCEKSSGYLKYLMLRLWKNKNLVITDIIIDKYLNNNDKEFFRLIDNVYCGKEISENDIINIVQKHCQQGPTDDEDDWDYFRKLEKRISYLLTELEGTGIGIPHLKTLISTYYKEKEKNKKLNGMSSHSLNKKIREYYYGKGEFKIVEEFNKTIGENSYSGELVIAQIKYAISTNTQQLHKEALEKYVKNLQKDFKELGNIFEDDKEKDGWRTFAWSKRFKAAQINARIYSSISIYEYLHGDDIVAKDYSLRMIQEAESLLEITKDYEEGKDEGTIQRNRGHAKIRILRRFKRKLKEDFFLAKLLQKLPKENGWSDKIKGEKKRKADRKEYEKKMGNNRNMYYYEETPKVSQSDIEQTELIKSFLDEDKLNDAIEWINSVSEWGACDGDWERGMLILDYSPNSFGTLYNILSKDYFNRDSYRFDRKSYKGMSQFYIKGYQLGVVDNSMWESLFDDMNESRFSREGGMTEMPHSMVLYLIKNTIDIGDITKAWDIFGQLKNYDRRYNGQSLSDSTTSTCLSYFIDATFNNESRGCVHLAMNNISLDDIEFSADEKISYWNAKANIDCHSKEDEKYQKSIKLLQTELKKSGNITESIRLLCKDLVRNCLRDNHQIKDEMIEIGKICSEEGGKNDRRIFNTLIELGIPGMEADKQIKQKNIPIRTQYFFFKKLIENDYITHNTEAFLTKYWRDNIMHLRRLLAQHQNEFNSVIDTVSENRESVFSLQDWEGVFNVLNIIGTITPWIWAQAKSCNFDKNKLKELGKKIIDTKKKMFLNKPLGEDITLELEAELIYQAFKPVNLSYIDVQNLLSKFEDCSDHLDKYSFQEEGYDIDLLQKKDLAFRKGKEEDESFNLHANFASTPLSEFEKKTIGRALCDIGMLKVDKFDKEGLFYILQLFSGNSEMLEITFKKGANERFNYLSQLQEILGVYLIDNLEELILLFFKDSKEFTSQMWSNFIKNISSNKRKMNLENQLKIDLGEEIDEESAAKIIAQAILQKSKALQKFRKDIKQEIGNYVYLDGTEIDRSTMNLKAYISKNKASFFAKASAGLCTDHDTASFEREDHFHFNVVDDTKQECVGNMMAYEIKHNNEKVLLLRGFNPNTSLLKKIDVASYCKSLIDIAKQFAQENDFKGIYMSETRGGWHALSNRQEVINYLMKKYGMKGENCSFKITENTHISKIFPIEKYDYHTNKKET